MEAVNSTLLDTVEAYVTNHITTKISKDYTYHDLQHTKNVVDAAKEIASYLSLPAKDLEMLCLAAWFHDVGYDEGPEGHEQRSADHARQYLAEKDYPEENIRVIEGCILATKMPSNPEGLLQEILCDADFSHLGKRNYWDRCSRVRQELNSVKQLIMSDGEWVDFEIAFLQQHNWFSYPAKLLYEKRKIKHLRQLVKQKKRLDPTAILPAVEVASTSGSQLKKKKKSKNAFSNIELKQLNLGRGVETMYRTTYRTHVNLSQMADNKANIMLSINAIVVSITLSSLVPRLGENPKLIFPTIILLMVCLVAIVFATLSTRPKITEGIFSREDIKQKKSNLLFFGNFYKMSLEDFQWGMTEMIKDSDFLYSSMTRDLYYLGIVLAKKYRYLRICYGVFMYGLIVAVASFAFIFLFQ